MYQVSILKVFLPKPPGPPFESITIEADILFQFMLESIIYYSKFYMIGESFLDSEMI
jgi:hypothetical protein